MDRSVSEHSPLHHPPPTHSIHPPTRSSPTYTRSFIFRVIPVGDILREAPHLVRPPQVPCPGHVELVPPRLCTGGMWDVRGVGRRSCVHPLPRHRMGTPHTPAPPPVIYRFKKEVTHRPARCSCRPGMGCTPTQGRCGGRPATSGTGLLACTTGTRSRWWRESCAVVHCARACVRCGLVRGGDDTMGDTHRIKVCMYVGHAPFDVPALNPVDPVGVGREAQELRLVDGVGVEQQGGVHRGIPVVVVCACVKTQRKGEEKGGL